MILMALAMMLLNQEKSDYQILLYTASIGIGFGGGNGGSPRR